MREEIEISVCVPAYNNGRFLSDCIESVLAQTSSNWELIVVDDSSTDNTSDIVQTYAKTNDRIRYIRNESRIGMNGNIKRAAESGRGKYLKMLCSDDWLAPECLTTLVDLMEQNPEVALATSAETLCDENGNPLQVQFLFGQPISILTGTQMLDRMATGEGFGGHSSFLIRSEAYRAIGGYDSSLLYAADYDLAARISRVGSYLHTDLPLFNGRLQPQSSSSVDPGKLFDVIDSFEIPAKVFQPRRFGNIEWRRFQRLTGMLTARYLVNVALQFLRGNRAYAHQLTELLLKYGNFIVGVPFLTLHIPARVYRRLTRRRVGSQNQLTRVQTLISRF